VKTAKGYEEPEGVVDVVSELLREFSTDTYHEIQHEMLWDHPQIKKGGESPLTSIVLCWFLEECSSKTLLEVVRTCIDFLSDRDEGDMLMQIREGLNRTTMEPEDEEDEGDWYEPSPEAVAKNTIDLEEQLKITEERNRRGEELARQLGPLMPRINEICDQYKGVMVKPATLDMVKSHLIAFLESQRIDGKLTQLPEIVLDWNGLTNEVVVYFKLPKEE
jgi:hypothetical protein